MRTLDPVLPSNPFVRISTASNVLVALVILGLLPPFGQTPAHALETASNLVIEEVLVTARRREERLIDTPVAVSALMAEEIERYNTRDLAQLTTRIPGVQISHAAGGGAGGNMIIRGVGNLAVDYGADQPVSLVLDGMSFSRGHILDTGFFDLAAVEVLKGPQTLYFGKNSPAGVISATSVSPEIGQDLDLFARAGYEFVTEDPVIEAGVSFALGEQLAFRLAGRYQDMQGGYLDNSAGPLDTSLLYGRPDLPSRGDSYDEFPAQEQSVVRLTTLWQPDDRFTANLKLFRSVSEQNDAGLTVLYACADGPGAHPYYTAFPDPTQVCKDGPRLVRNGGLPPAEIADAHPYVDAGDRYFNRLDNTIVTLDMAWELGNFTLSSLTGYWDYKHREYTNYDYTSYGVVISKQGESGDSWSQELRLQSNFDGPLNFMVGAFYEQMNRDLDAPVQILPSAFFAPGQVPFPGPGFYNGTYINYHNHWDNDIESYSAFGSFDWQLAQHWTVSGGVRYTREERSAVGGNLFENSGFLGFSPSGVTYRPDGSADNVSPELTLSWTPRDNLLVYGAYKTGFQSFGISNPGTVPDLTALTPAQQDDALIFDESTVEGFEAGIKGYFLDDRLTADLTVYYLEYDDLQVGIFNPVTTTFTIQNAAAATNQGIEAQGTYQATDRLQLRLAAQYNRLEFDDYTNAGCNAYQDTIPVDQLPATGPGCHVGPDGSKIQDMSGERYGGPPFQANAGASYLQPIGSWRFALDVDIIYYDEGEEALRLPGSAVPSRTVSNVSLRLEQQDGPWSAALICSNCGDEIYVTSIQPKPLAKFTPTSGDLTGQIGMPRLVQLQLQYTLD